MRLRSLDSSASFKFMDLLPELRLLVYRELLGQDNSLPSVSIYPAILTTCKSINKEATDILYNEAPLHIKIVSYARDKRRDIDFSAVVQVENLDSFRSAMYTDLLGNWKHWPSVLTRVQNITLTIFLGEYRVARQTMKRKPFEKVTHGIYALACLVAHAGRIRKITVNFEESGEILSLDTSTRTICPLAKLGPSVTYTFHGVAAELETIFRDHAQVSLTTTYNTLQMYLGGGASVMEILDLLFKSDTGRAQAKFFTLILDGPQRTIGRMDT